MRCKLLCFLEEGSEEARTLKSEVELSQQFKVCPVLIVTLKTDSGKDTFKRMKRQATDWEKMFAKDPSAKDCIQIRGKLFKPNSKETARFKDGPPHLLGQPEQRGRRAVETLCVAL